MVKWLWRVLAPRYHYAQRRHITKAIVLRWAANLLHIECIIATVQRNSILQEKLRMTRCSEMAGVRVSRAFQEKRICSSGPPCPETPSILQEKIRMTRCSEMA